MNKILIKLLAIKIVANNFLGFFSCSITVFIPFFLASNAWSTLYFESEKKAISVPEIKAEQTNKTNRDIICKSNDQLKGIINKKRMGSRSK